MSEKDYYEILQVSRNASDAEIKKAYRRLAMQCHPDRKPDDKEAEARFKDIQKAYAVLSDSRKRSAYDQFGHAGVNQSAGAGAAGFDFGDMFGDIGDMFGDIFGGGRSGGSSRQQRGADLGYEIEITLAEAVHGVSKTIQLPTHVACETCDGSGAKKGTSPVSCHQCSGSGHVQMRHGFLTVQQTCPTCHGQGKVIKEHCSSCRGQGMKRKTQTLKINVPAGVDTGDRIRLEGKGEAGLQGALPGDLYVQIQVKSHTLFQRDGNDLYVEVPVDFVTAALGGEVGVPTLTGQVTLTLPQETQSGKLFRLKGRGVKALRNSRTGDLLCRVVVETPVKLSAEQKELLKKFQASLTKDRKTHSPKAKTWLDSVKEFFASPSS